MMGFEERHDFERIETTGFKQKNQNPQAETRKNSQTSRKRPLLHPPRRNQKKAGHLDGLNENPRNRGSFFYTKKMCYTKKKNLETF